MEVLFAALVSGLLAIVSAGLTNGYHLKESKQMYAHQEKLKKIELYQSRKMDAAEAYAKAFNILVMVQNQENLLFYLGAASVFCMYVSGKNREIIESITLVLEGITGKVMSAHAEGRILNNEILRKFTEGIPAQQRLIHEILNEETKPELIDWVPSQKANPEGKLKG